LADNDNKVVPNMAATVKKQAYKNLRKPRSEVLSSVLAEVAADPNTRDSTGFSPDTVIQVQGIKLKPNPIGTDWIEA
jgi:hypothetical protein